jgi:hypothetical protein
VITDRVEGDDDFLLSGIRHRHLSIRGHAGIYVARTSEPGFSGNCGWSMLRGTELPPRVAVHPLQGFTPSPLRSDASYPVRALNAASEFTQQANQVRQGSPSRQTNHAANLELSVATPVSDRLLRSWATDLLVAVDLPRSFSQAICGLLKRLRWYSILGGVWPRSPVETRPYRGTRRYCHIVRLPRLSRHSPA